MDLKNLRFENMKKRLEFKKDSYSLTADQLVTVVNLIIDDCRSSWSYGEGVDLPVLGLRIDRLIEGTEDEIQT